MPSRVAVVIVNFRIYDDLDRALSSLDAGLHDDDRVVVFDQASDRTRLAEVTARHPRVQAIASPDNIGFAAAVNRAAARTDARYVLLLNPDATIEGPAIDVLVDWLEAHPEAGLAGPRVLDVDGTVQASARRFPGLSTSIAGRSTWLSKHFPNNWLTRRNLLARDATGPAAVDWLAGSCLMIRRELFDRLGGFDEGFFLYWEDADFAWRAREAGFGCAYIPTVAVRHIGGRAAASDPALAIRAFHRSAYRMFIKHTGPLGRLLAPAARVGLWLRGEWRVWRFTR